MRKLLLLLCVLPSFAWAQYDELKPPKPMPWPSSSDLNSMNNVGKSPNCDYFASATAARLPQMASAVVSLDIGYDGAAKKAEVSISSGSDHLDRASRECVLSWRYLLTNPSRPASTKITVLWRVTEASPSPQGDAEYVGKPVVDRNIITALGL